MKTGKVRFSLPYTKEQVNDILIGCLDAEVKYRHREPIHNDMTMEYINQASSWLLSTDKFGLLICGSPGNGKTTLMKAIIDAVNFADVHDENGKVCRVYIKDAKEITRLCKTDYNEYKRCMMYDMLAIDDLGCEPTEVVDYGNIINPVIDLLSYRYNEQLFTIVTTNLQPQQIREKYGDRLADRFNEMMDRIIFRNSTYRK